MVQTNFQLSSVKADGVNWENGLNQMAGQLPNLVSGVNQSIMGLVLLIQD